MVLYIYIYRMPLSSMCGNDPDRRMFGNDPDRWMFLWLCGGIPYTDFVSECRFVMTFGMLYYDSTLSRVLSVL